MRVEIAVPATARVGEGPVWNTQTRQLHWVDILSGAIHTSDVATGQTTTVTVPTLVGAAVPRHAGGFVAATAEGFATVDADGILDTRLSVLPDGVRMNDAKCDGRGRLWAGSTAMDFKSGAGMLHVLLPDWTTRVVLEGLTLPNGLGWSADQRTFYLIDTIEGELCAFDADPQTPDISRRRALFRFPPGEAMPDGLTIDAAGCVWVAMWGGGRVVRISPRGELLAEIPMPAHQASSCTFGGTDLDALYVTTAREGLELGDDDPAGSVYVVLGQDISGLPSTPFAG